MKWIARAVLITAGMIWGLGFIGNKYVLDAEWTYVQLLFVRFVSAYIFITLFFIRRVLKANRQVIKQGLFLGVFLFLGFFFQTWGLEYTTASNNALITAAYIIILPGIVYLFDKVNVPSTTIAAAAITLIGVAIISIDFDNLAVGIGDILTFIGAIFWAIHIYFLGHQTRKHDLFALLSYQLLMFSIIITSIMFATDGIPTITRGADNVINVWLLAILLGFGASFLAFVLQAFGQKHTNASEAAILLSTESVFGPIFALFLLNESWSWKLLVGMLLITGGIVLSEMGGNLFKRKKKEGAVL